mgnify:CR=1 FL=1
MHNPCTASKSWACILFCWGWAPAPCVVYLMLQLNEDGGEDDDEGEDGVVSYREWQLPSVDIEGQWDALFYESAIKRKLLQYASTALLFSDLGVNNQLISWNR